MGRQTKLPSALKHAAFSETAVLPGESQAEYDKLRQQVFDDLTPQGPLEEDIVGEVARLLWRKRNLDTYRIAEAARARHREIEREHLAAVPELPSYIGHGHHEITDEMVEERAAAIQQAKEAARLATRKELGSAFVFVEQDIGDYARLAAELNVEDRLQSAIDRCMKRLLHVKGYKSLIASPPIPTSNLKQIAAKYDAA